MSQPARSLPPLVELHDQPGHLIRRAHQIAVAVFFDKLGRDVTPVQYAVMHTLMHQPGLDQLTLAQAVALDTSTTADIAARLEAKGWITREVRARGQRSLQLTEEGLAVLHRLADGIGRLQESLLGRLSPQEQADFLRLLRKFVEVNNDLSRAPQKRG